MLRWLDSCKVHEKGINTPITKAKVEKNVTDDPLATIIAAGKTRQKNIYSVSRSVLLPRVSLKNYTFPTDDTSTGGGGINPLFLDSPGSAVQHHRPLSSNYKSPQSREKSTSSGYGDSNSGSVLDPYQEHLKHMEEVGVLIEQNPAFVKSIKISTRGIKPNKSVPFHATSSGDTLTTIPEGIVDLPVPKPIWPLQDKQLRDQYDSIVDDALLLYTSLNYHPEKVKSLDTCIDLSVKDLLLEILNGINDTLEGRNSTPPENMLKIIDERIRLKLDTIRASTEEEMKRLYVNLTNCRKKNSVLRALSNSTSSGNSSKTSSSRIRTLSIETEDVYEIPEIPSRSSSSGFSDHQNLPVFVHDNLVGVPNIVRNALIYGTLCRSKFANDALLSKYKKTETLPKKSLLKAVNDDKPSIWEQYYGVKAVEEGNSRYPSKPTDVPLYPGGRPEADFTLDVPRSEQLMRRMQKDKKWRCRCRLLTSFLGLIFFLLSVMAVSLLLTRGKKMFGSMV